MHDDVIQVHHYPDADVLIRFKPIDEPVTEVPANTPPPAPSTYTLLLVLFVAMLLPLLSVLFQVYVALHPLTATVSILASQQGALPGTRTLQPVTLSQSQTGPTTGIGHENARAATGTVTFYNGLFTAQLIPQGTVFTGSDGIQVMTDADISIPPANPPAFAVVSVFAHALLPGTAGNIQAGDISTTIANGILVKNLGPFYGGKNARSYHTVTQADINALSTAVQARSIQKVFESMQKQLQTGEEMTTPQCHMSIASPYAVGVETDQVTVLVSATCKAYAYSVERLKRYLAGKDTQAVLHQFKAYGQIAIRFDGVGDSSRLPQENFIHLIFIVQERQQP
jgi:Baseplate J-like protein